MKHRRGFHYPPYGRSPIVLVQSSRLEEAAGWAASLGRWFQSTQLDGVRVLGPATAPIARIKRIYRFHLLLKAGSRQALARTLHLALAQADNLGIPRRNLIVDVDAVNLM